MVLIGYVLLLIVSFYLLAQVSDKYFVVSLDKIAERLKMSHDMAGATLMAVGSSAPELFVALIALFRVSDTGHEELGVGTIVGSALFNILVIIGASALVRKATLRWQPVLRDLSFYILSIIALFVVFRDGHTTLIESLSLVALYFVYLYAVAKWRKIFDFDDDDDLEEEDEEEEESKQKWTVIFAPFDFILHKFFSVTKFYVINFFLSIFMIAILSWVLVESAISVAHILEIPEFVVALTVLAVGTSIPDLMSSIIVARQGRGGMAVSNAIGSNIFDVLIGLGLPWSLVIMLRDEVVVTKTDGLIESIYLLLASVVFIFLILVFRKWQMGKFVGFFLIALYLIYLVYSAIEHI